MKADIQVETAPTLECLSPFIFSVPHKEDPIWSSRAPFATKTVKMIYNCCIYMLSISKYGNQFLWWFRMNVALCFLQLWFVKSESWSIPPVRTETLLMNVYTPYIYLQSNDIYLLLCLSEEELDLMNVFMSFSTSVCLMGLVLYLAAFLLTVCSLSTTWLGLTCQLWSKKTSNYSGGWHATFCFILLIVEGG